MVSIGIKMRRLNVLLAGSAYAYHFKKSISISKFALKTPISLLANTMVFWLSGYVCEFLPTLLQVVSKCSQKKNLHAEFNYFWIFSILDLLHHSLIKWF